MLDQALTYLHSVDARMHLACVMVGILTYIFVVRYIIAILRTPSLSYWPLRALFAVVVLTFGKLLWEFGYGTELGFIIVLSLCFDFYFFEARKLPPNGS